VRSEPFSKSSRSLIVVAALASMLGTAGNAQAQALKDVQAPDSPLVLKAQGSFFVGGEKAAQTQGELGDLGPGGQITINQMYVRYMVPQGGDGSVPVVMVHGATLTGKSWETTPDGRMGWDEYFVRKGHPVYVPDQVGRGRSGFNQAVFNDARSGSVPAANLPRWIRFSDEVVWPNFRFGSRPGAPYADSQFPLTAVDELSKQGVRDVSFGGVPNPNPTFKALSDLAAQVNGAVLMGHSQSGAFPLAAALINPSVAKGLILVEPGGCPTNYTDEQITTLATLPILAVFGDHRDTPTGIGIRPSWQLSFEGCQALIDRLKKAGGQAQMLRPDRDRPPRQQSHDHAGQKQPADRRSDPQVDRRAREQADWCRPHASRTPLTPPSACNRAHDRATASDTNEDSRRRPRPTAIPGDAPPAPHGRDDGCSNAGSRGASSPDRRPSRTGCDPGIPVESCQ
jgi:pimeloyl-ACP methyl ester carboxylesterase